jgi:putative membrane protein
MCGVARSCAAGNVGDCFFTCRELGVCHEVARRGHSGCERDRGDLYRLDDRTAAILASVAHAGVGGLGLLCGYALAMLGILAAAWKCLMPHACRVSLRTFFLARLVRDSISDITPFSPVAGMLASARLATLGGMEAGFSLASVVADATTETMAQVAFLLLGLSLGASYLLYRWSAIPLTAAGVAVLVLSVLCIASMILLQKKGAGWADRIIERRFPTAQKGRTLHQCFRELYGSRARLGGAAFLHLLGWISAGGGTFVAFRLAGGRIGIVDALALESLLAALRSLAVFVPGGIGVQEAGYAMLAPIFGLPAELGFAVSLLKRAREVVLGVPALVYWQVVEGRTAAVLGKS